MKAIPALAIYAIALSFAPQRADATFFPFSEEQLQEICLEEYSRPERIWEEVKIAAGLMNEWNRAEETGLPLTASCLGRIPDGKEIAAHVFSRTWPIAALLAIVLATGGAIMLIQRTVRRLVRRWKRKNAIPSD